jgi:hypothetical protein
VYEVDIDAEACVGQCEILDLVMSQGNPGALYSDWDAQGYREMEFRIESGIAYDEQGASTDLGRCLQTYVDSFPNADSLANANADTASVPTPSNMARKLKSGVALSWLMLSMISNATMVPPTKMTRFQLQSRSQRQYRAAAFWRLVRSAFRALRRSRRFIISNTLLVI